MSARVASQFVLNKPGNLGAADPSGIAAELIIQLYADEDTAEPLGFVITFNKLTKGAANYIINDVTGDDNYIVVQFVEEELI